MTSASLLRCAICNLIDCQQQDLSNVGRYWYLSGYLAQGCLEIDEATTSLQASGFSKKPLIPKVSIELPIITGKG